MFLFQEEGRMDHTETPLHELGHVAERAGFSIARARYLFDVGKLPGIRTSAGTRLVTDTTLKKFLEKRKERMTR